MLPVVSSIDLFIVPARLEAAGYTVAAATELFGYLTGMAVALINLPTILTASLAVGLVPAISEAFTLGRKERIYDRTATAMRIANLITIPSFAGMCLLATPISQMLYGTPNAGDCIAILSFGIVLLGVHQVTTGVLQGLGHTTIPLVNMMASAVVKIGMSWYLTAMPELGIKGAAWATNVDFGVAALLNMYFVHRYVGFSLDWGHTLRTVASAAVMGIAVIFSFDALFQTLHSNTVATLGAILLGATVYFASMLIVGGVTAQEVEKIPRIGAKLTLCLQRIGLLRH